MDTAQERAERALDAIAAADPNASRGLAAAIAQLGVTPSTAMPPLDGAAPAARWGTDEASRDAFARMLDLADGREGLERGDDGLVFSVPAHDGAAGPAAPGARDLFRLGIVGDHLELVGLGRRTGGP